MDLKKLLGLLLALGLSEFIFVRAGDDDDDDGAVDTKDDDEDATDTKDDAKDKDDDYDLDKLDKEVAHFF